MPIWEAVERGMCTPVEEIEQRHTKGGSFSRRHRDLVGMLAAIRPDRLQLAVWLLLASCVGYLLCKLLLAAVRFWRTMAALKRMPHVKEDGILGWKEFVFDQQHLPYVMAKAANEHGGIFSFRVLQKFGVVVTDPALAQQVLTILDLPKSEPTYHVFNTLTSPDARTTNLLTHLTSDGYWRAVRRGVSPAFSPRNIRAEFPHVVDLTNRICAILSSAGPATYLDLDNLLQRESMDVIGRIGFATDFGAIAGFRQQQAQAANGAVSTKGSEAGQGAGGSNPAQYANSGLDTDDVLEVVRAGAVELVRRWTEPWRYPLRYMLPDAWRGEQRLRAVHARMWRLMKEVRARGEPDPEDMTIAAHLLRIRDPDTGKPLTNAQLASEIGIFFMAGFETTGHSMAWALYFLATHPEVEAKVCAELDALGLLVTPSRPSPRPLEYEDLGKLRYLGMAIKEAMRLLPVVGGGTLRRTVRALELGGYTIPAGVDVGVPFQGLMTSVHNWERGNEYLPERWEQPGVEYWHGPLSASGSVSAGVAGEEPQPRNWTSVPEEEVAGGRGLLEEEEEQEQGRDSSTGSGDARPPRRFLPFSAGLRSCVGQNLAKMNYTATLAILLSKFTFQLPPELLGPGALWDLQCFRTTMQPANGLPMRCTPRPAAA